MDKFKKRILGLVSYFPDIDKLLPKYEKDENFHVIKIDGQKNIQTALKLATFGRQIVASETTENMVFQKAEQFALATSKEKKFFTIAKENKYITKPVVGLKVLDENVPGLGNQRQIISWAFGRDTKPGDFKRFDL